jgi:hypothetical protein
MIPDYITLDAIKATTSRVPFHDSDRHFLMGYLKTCESKGRDLHISYLSRAEGNEARDGIFILSSPSMLQRDFLFVKCNAGRGFLGGQKATCNSYVGSAEDDQWMIGPIFRYVAIALTSITNVYEGEGFR